MSIHWEFLRKKIVAEFPGGTASLHGPRHWRRVEKTGLIIAGRNGALVEVVRLFALFHDSRRTHDGWDMKHGADGAAFALSLRGDLFDLSDEHFALLHEACADHTSGRTSDDPTVGTCWDADRLDLGRVGIRPESRYMSTQSGREMAERLPHTYPAGKW